MKVIGDIGAVKEERHLDPTLSWGTVLTMGYLHEGHLSLIRRAREENDRLSVTIFVNPTQFGSQNDLAEYPKDIDRDLQLLAKESVDLVFVPTPEVIYPSGFQTTIQVEMVSRLLEGASRPGHFDGVATVVTKFFNILEPDKAYFGQKDAQQVIVLRRLVDDLNLKVKIVVCPTKREPAGLAMSSRNVRLSREERKGAAVLFEALQASEVSILAGEKSGDSIRKLMREIIGRQAMTKIDYVSAADPETLEELSRIDGSCLLSLAVYFGEVRLIDNILMPQATMEIG